MACILMKKSIHYEFTWMVNYFDCSSSGYNDFLGCKNGHSNIVVSYSTILKEEHSNTWSDWFRWSLLFCKASIQGKQEHVNHSLDWKNSYIKGFETKCFSDRYFNAIMFDLYRLHLQIAERYISSKTKIRSIVNTTASYFQK